MNCKRLRGGINALSGVGYAQIKISIFLLFVAKMTDLKYFDICLSLKFENLIT